MKEFINKHPFITAGIIFGVCNTIIKIVSILKGKTEITLIINKNLKDLEKKDICECRNQNDIKKSDVDIQEV